LTRRFRNVDAAKSMTTQSSQHICTVCGRRCAAKIGLSSYMRTHNTGSRRWPETHLSVKTGDSIITPFEVTEMIFAILEDWYNHIVLTHSYKLVSFFTYIIIIISVAMRLHVKAKRTGDLSWSVYLLSASLNKFENWLLFADVRL